MVCYYLNSFCFRNGVQCSRPVADRLVLGESVGKSILTQSGRRTHGGFGTRKTAVNVLLIAVSPCDRSMFLYQVAVFGFRSAPFSLELSSAIVSILPIHGQGQCVSTTEVFADDARAECGKW